jgi:hypothetical protein
VTHAYSPSASTPPRFVIPNAEARRDYLEVADRLLQMSSYHLQLYDEGVRMLLDTGSIDNLIGALETMDGGRTGHSIVHSEAGFHEGV